MRCPIQLHQNRILNTVRLESSEHGDYRDVSFPLSGNQGYHSNWSVPFRAVTRHHGEFSVMGTIFNPAMREATKPVPDTHSAKIEYAHTYFPPIVTLLGELTADRWR